MKPSSSLLLLISLLVLTVSCKKEKTESKPKTKTELLTSKTWMYDEYFRNYNSANTVLYYKRGKANNLINMNAQRSNFKADGTYTEILANGAPASGTWKFLNNETQIQVNTPVGIFVSNIVLLDENHFHWYEPNADNGTFGKMIPAP